MDLELLSIDEYRKPSNNYPPHTFIKFKGDLVSFRFLRRFVRKLPCKTLVVQDPYTIITVDAQVKHEDRAQTNIERLLDMRYQTPYSFGVRGKPGRELLKEKITRKWVFAIRIFDTVENLQSSKYDDMKKSLVYLKLAHIN